MSILAANLKHLYQRRAVWLWYAMLLCQTPIILMPLFWTKFDRYLGYIIVSLIAGLLAGSLQKDISTKPFSFCLPNHRRIPRAFIFWLGGVVNPILGCVFFGYPGLGFPYVLLVVLAGISIGMIVYFYGVYLSFQVLPTLAGGIFPLFLFGAIFFEWDRILQDMIVSSPVVVTGIGFLICGWAWRQLGRDFLARKFCGKLVKGMFDGFNRQKAEKLLQQQASKKERKYQAVFLNWFGRVFCNRMERYDFLSTGRYVCGNLYTVLGGCLRMLRPGISALLTLGFVVYFGYLASIGKGKVQPLIMTSFVYLFPALIVINIELLPCPGLLVPAGRSQKFCAMLTTVMVLTFLGVILLLVLTWISLLLEGHIPDIKLHGLSLSYHAFDIRLLPLFVMFIPVSFCISVLFQKNNIVRIITMIGLMQIMIVAGVTRSLMNIRFGPLLLAMLAVVFWGLFLFVLRYVCMKRSLVGQGR